MIVPPHSASAVIEPPKLRLLSLDLVVVKFAEVCLLVKVAEACLLTKVEGTDGVTEVVQSAASIQAPCRRPIDVQIEFVFKNWRQNRLFTSDPSQTYLTGLIKTIGIFICDE